MIGLAQKWMDMEASQWFVKGLKAVLSLLMSVLLLSLLAGVVKTASDLKHLLTDELDVALRRIIIDALILLAIVEVFRTILAYFTEGRVKVTFIVDTVLVVMLTEVISLWFRGGGWTTSGSISLLLVTLGLMRITAVQYSPTRKLDRAGET